MKTSVLLIEDDESFFQSVTLILKEQPIEIVWAESGAKGIQLYRQNPHKFATVIIDYILPDLKGSEVCQHLRKLNPDQDFLFASGHQNPDYLTDLLETGASGFLKKGRSTDEIRAPILKSVATYQKKTRVLGCDGYEPSKAELELKANGFIGRTEAMYQLLKEVRLAAASPYPTLIVGETGTGKELVAKALVPAGKSLVALSCASFIERENLLESELFGYVKGAFTGADRDTVGLVTQAQNNVLFLDELHQLSLAAQAKLLRFLQEMRFRKVGDNGAKETTVKFKLIAAVQPDIKERLKDGRFLPDLIERVGALVIHVPALRDRLEDIEPLVRCFQDGFNSGRPQAEQKQFRISTIAEMMKHPWPTNVRGLQNAAKQMLTNCSEDIVQPKDFRSFLDKDIISPKVQQEQSPVPLQEASRTFEVTKITNALKSSRTQTEAAIRLGLPISSLSRKLSKLGINPVLFLRRA